MQSAEPAPGPTEKIFLPERRRWILFPVTVILLVPFALLSIDLHHTGVMLQPAVDFANGAAVFRDTFSQYGFLTVVLQGVAVKLFGAELLVIQLLTVMFYGLIAVELDRMWSGFLPPLYRWATLGLFWVLAPSYLLPFHPWSSVYALYFMLLGANLFLSWLRHSDGRLLFLSGLCGGLAFGMRQPCGVVMVLFAMIALGLAAWSRRCSLRRVARQFGIWLGGMAMIPAILALYLTWHRAWAQYMQQTVLYVIQWGADRGGGGLLPILQNFFPANAFTIFPLATLTVFGLAVYRLYRRQDSDFYLPLAVAAVAGLAAWHQYHPVPCLRHLYWGAVPMFGALAWLSHYVWVSGLQKKFTIFIIGALWLMPALEGFWHISGGLFRLSTIAERQRVDIPGIRGMLLLPAELRYFKRMEFAFTAVPEEYRDRYYLNLTPDGLFHIYFPPQKPIHPMFVNWGNQVDPGYTEFMMEFARNHRPVVLGLEPEPFPGYRTVAGFPENEPVYFLSIPPF